MLDRTVKIKVDQELCDGCGNCVAVCPAETISIQNKKAQVTGTESLSCGHCIAACPREAIRIDDNQFEPVRLNTVSHDAQWVEYGDFDTAELFRLMMSRRSCRKFKSKAVDREILEDLIRFGRTAPSGSNCQEWTFTIFPEKADVRKLGEKIGGFFKKLNSLCENPLLRKGMALLGNKKLQFYYENYYESVKEKLELYDAKGVDKLFHGAGAVIMVGGKQTASCPAEDALLATQNMLLGAHAMGLGTCLIGFAVSAIQKDQSLQRDLQIPDDESIYSVIALGYPADRYQGMAIRKMVNPRGVTL